MTDLPNYNPKTTALLCIDLMDIDGPAYAYAILTTKELVTALNSEQH